MLGVPLHTLPFVIYIGIFCYWVLSHYNMSFKTIAGGFNGAFWWYGPLSEDWEKFEQIYQNYLVALSKVNRTRSSLALCCLKLNFASMVALLSIVIINDDELSWQGEAWAHHIARISGWVGCEASNSAQFDFSYMRRIYIANFAIFKIATVWSYHLHLREKSRSFSFTKLRDFLVGSAHVRSQATVHAAHAVCMRAEDIDTRCKERT